jgi:hypothetical protein
MLDEWPETLCKRFATHEPFAAFLFEFVEALHEWPAVLRERFATQEPLAAVLDRTSLTLCFA